MPGVITVPEFIRETKEDYSSPTTSTFVNRIPQCRETVNKVEEVSTIISFGTHIRSSSKNVKMLLRKDNTRVESR